MLGSRLAYAPVDHPTWPLQNALLRNVGDEFVAAAGYQVGNADPVVHYSDGVDVRIGLPRRLETA